MSNLSLVSIKRVARAGNVVVLDEKNPHIRHIRDGTTIMLDENVKEQKAETWQKLRKQH